MNRRARGDESPGIPNSGMNPGGNSCPAMNSGGNSCPAMNRRAIIKLVIYNSSTNAENLFKGFPRGGVGRLDAEHLRQGGGNVGDLHKSCGDAFADAGAIKY